MTKKEYYNGLGLNIYGVWNTVQKRWQFKEIREKRPIEAFLQLKRKIGYDALKWRFEIRPLPIGKKVWRICDNHRANDFNNEPTMIVLPYTVIEEKKKNLSCCS